MIIILVQMRDISLPRTDDDFIIILVQTMREISLPRSDDDFIITFMVNK